MALIGTICAIPAQASADQRVVLLPFTGKKANAVSASFRDALRRQRSVETLSASSMYTAAKRLGYSRRDLRDGVTLSVVAAEIQADAVVSGSISSKGRTSFLHVKVRDGGTGDKLGSHKVRLRRGKLDSGAARAAVSRLMPAIRKGAWQPSGGSEDSGGGGFDPVDDMPSRDDRLSGGRGRGDDLPPLDDDLAPLAPEPSGYASASAHMGPGTADLRLSAGVVSLSRAYDLSGALTDDGRPLPHNYETGYFAGFHLGGEMYPFAMAGEAGAMEAIGIQAYVDRATTESSLDVIDDEGPKKVDGVETTQLMWGLSAIYRTFPGSTDHGPVSLRLFGGWHATSFGLEQGTEWFKRIDYGSVRLGADGWLPVGRSDDMTFSLRGRLGLLWTQADINDREVYPTSSAVGWEGAAGMDVDLGGDWSLAGDYRFYTFGVEFPAAGAGRPALESDDLYHGVVLELSYRPFAPEKAQTYNVL